MLKVEKTNHKKFSSQAKKEKTYFHGRFSVDSRKWVAWEINGGICCFFFAATSASILLCLGDFGSRNHKLANLLNLYPSGNQHLLKWKLTMYVNSLFQTLYMPTGKNGKDACRSQIYQFNIYSWYIKFIYVIYV